MKRFRKTRLVTLLASTVFFSLTLADTYSANTADGYDSDFPDANPALADYNQVGQPMQDGPDSLTFSNQDFGMQGPLNVSSTYSSAFGYELEASYTRLLNSMNAISLLGSYSGDENRIDITWAHAWDVHQRTKLSVERLAQKLDFDYDSGSVSEWVPQYAVGAGYQYLIDNSWLQSLEFSGYYAQADSKDLDTIRFVSDGNTYDNYRHIAGAASQGVALTADVLPWTTGLMSLGLNYDSVDYDTKYEDTDAEDSSGLGFTVGMEQVLTKHTKLALSASQRETYDTYSAKLSVLTPNNMELGFSTETTQGNDGTNDDSYSLDLAYYFDDDSRYHTGYAVTGAGSSTSLTSWAAESLAYMNLVLAAADQRTELVTEANITDNDALQADDEPTINLVTGSVNTVNIASYIDKTTLTSEQQQQTPKIFGGPADVSFSYDPATATLVTEQIVPDTDAGQQFKPLVMIFPTNDQDETTDLTPAERLKQHLANQLGFRVKVTGGSNPYVNSGLATDYTVFTDEPLSLPTFYLENPDDPATTPQDSNVLFINPSEQNKFLYIDKDHYGSYVTFTNAEGKEDACYSYSVGPEEDQTFMIESTQSATCPDTATATIVACNDFVCSTEPAVLNLTASSLAQPFVGGNTNIDSVAVTEAYNYPFAVSEVSAGQDSDDNYATFNEADTEVQIMQNSTGSCVDVTKASGLSLQFNNNSGSDPSVQPTVTLNSTEIPQSFADDGVNQLLVYIHVINNESDPQEADNGSKEDIANCAGSPFKLPVAYPPTISDNIDLGTANVDEDYSYSFIDNGMVSSGSSNFDPESSTSSLTVLDSDNNVVATDPDDLGLAVTISATDIVLNGTLAAKYAGDNLQVVINPLCNIGDTVAGVDGTCTTGNSAAPATLVLSANPDQAPSVTGGTPVNDAQTSNNYSDFAFKSTVAPGTGRSFTNINNGTSSTDTYVKVVTDDADATDVTDQVHVQLSDNGDSTLDLIGDGTVVDKDLSDGTYNVYVHVYNDANVAASNCSPADCSTLTNGAGTPFTLQLTNTTPIVDASGNNTMTNMTTGKSYSNTFSLSQVTAGGDQAFAGLNGSDSGTYAEITDSSNEPVALDDLGLILDTTDTAPYQLILKTTDGSTIPDDLVSGSYSVCVFVTNDTDTAQTATNCTDGKDPFVLTVTNPSETPDVPGNSAIDGAETAVAYPGYTFPASLTAGLHHEFASLNTESSEGTYVKVIAPDGSDVTDEVNVELATTGSGDDQQLQLVDKSSGEVATSLATNSKYDVFVHVYNDAGVEASNCSDDSCTSITYASGTPYTLPVTNITPSVYPSNASNPFVTETAGSNFVTYTFNTGSTADSTGEVNAGDTKQFDLSNSSVTITSSDETTVTSDMHVKLGHTAGATDALELISDGTAISSSLHSGDYNVCVNVTNTASPAQSASNCGSDDAAFVLHLTNPAETPDVPGNSAIDGAETAVAYPGYTFPASLTAGLHHEFASLNTESSEGTYVKVIAPDGSDVTDEVNVELATTGSGDDQQLQLVDKSSGEVATSLATNSKYDVFVHVYNDAGVEASNCSDDSCTSITYASGTPYTLPVTNITPSVYPSNASNPFVTETAGSNFVTYTFNTGSTADSTGEVNAGDTKQFDLSNSSVTITSSDETTVTSDMHVKLGHTAGATDALELISDGTAISSSLHSGDYNVCVNVTNTASPAQSASNCGSDDAAFVLHLTNPAETPDVPGNSAIDGAETAVAYPGYTFPASLTAGLHHEFASLNTESSEGTYVKVIAPDGSDVTDEVNVELATTGSGDDQQLQLVDKSSGEVATSLATNSKYDVFVHVYNDAGVEASNCSDDSCTSITYASGTPYTLPVTNITPSVYPSNASNPFVTETAGSNFVTYTFNTGSTADSTGEVNAGDTKQFDLSNSSVTITSSDETTVTSDMHVKLGHTAGATDALELISDGTAISSSLHSGDYNVCVNVTNTASPAQSASNCGSDDAAFVLHLTNPAESPSVPGNQVLPATDTSVVYPVSDQLLTGVTAGQTHDFAKVNTVGTDGTYVKVIASDNTDVTAKFPVKLTASGDSGSETLYLINDSNGTVASDLASGEYHVFIHVANSDGDQASNCGNDECSSLAYGSGTPDTIQLTNTQPVVAGGAINAATTSVSYSDYNFSSSQISPGSGKTSYQSTSLYITDANGGTDDVSSSLHVSLKDNGDGSLSLVSDGSPVSTSLTGTSYSVYIQVTNDNGETTSNCAANTCNESSDTPFTIDFTNTQPSVPESLTLSDATEGASYSQVLTDVTPGVDSATGSTTSYANLNNGTDEGDTYVQIKDADGDDVTSDFGMTLSDDGKTLTMSAEEINPKGKLSAGTYNVTIHVANNVGETADNTTAYQLTLISNEQTVYVTCPTADQIPEFSNEPPDEPYHSDIVDANNNYVATQIFSDVETNYGFATHSYMELNQAKLVSEGNDNYKLKCHYTLVNNVNYTLDIKLDGSESELLKDAEGVGSHWSGTTCTPRSSTIIGDNVGDCQVQFTR